MKETKLFGFNLPNILKEYLETKSKENFTTISQYIIDLIVDDMKNNKITKKDLYQMKWLIESQSKNIISEDKLI